MKKIVVVGIVFALLVVGVFAAGCTGTNADTAIDSIVGSWLLEENGGSMSLEIEKDLSGTLLWDFDNYKKKDSKSSAYVHYQKVNIKLTKTGEKTYNVGSNGEQIICYGGSSYTRGPYDVYLDIGKITQVSDDKIDLSINGNGGSVTFKRMA